MTPRTTVDDWRVTRPRLRVIVKETRGIPTGYLRAPYGAVRYNRESRKVGYDEAIILGSHWLNKNTGQDWPRRRRKKWCHRLLSSLLPRSPRTTPKSSDGKFETLLGMRVAVPRPSALGHPTEVPQKPPGREKGNIPVCFVLLFPVILCIFWIRKAFWTSEGLRPTKQLRTENAEI